MLRYFKDQEIQAGTIELAMINTQVRSRNEREVIYVTQFVNPFVLKFSDQRWLNEITDDGNINIETAINNYEKGEVVIPCHFNNLSSLNKEEAINMISYYRRILLNTRQGPYAQYDSVNRKMLYLLRKVYKLK